MQQAVKYQLLLFITFILSLFLASPIVLYNLIYYNNTLLDLKSMS